MSMENALGGRQALEQIENKAIRILRNGVKDDVWTILRKLRAEERSANSLLFSPELALTIFEDAQFSDNDLGLLRKSAFSENPDERAKFHEFLSFAKMYSESLLNITPSDDEHEEYERIKYEESEGRQTFTTELLNLLRDLASKSENFLVLLHLQDSIESFALWNEEKSGSLSGVPGGSRDDIIYTHAHIRESYDLRRAIGYYEGYLMAQPVLPFSRNVIAIYNDFEPTGLLASGRRKDDAEIESEDRDLVAKNDNQHDWIYAALAIPDRFSRGDRFDSNELNKLQALWNLDTDLKSEGQEFFFDLTRIDEKQLHPFVYSDVLHRNFELLKKRHTEKDVRPRPILDLVNKEEVVDPEQYVLLNSLSIRKKIEEELGLNYAKLSSRELAGLLAFLERTKEHEVHGVRQFFKNNGLLGARAFLVAAIDASASDEIIALDTWADTPEKNTAVQSVFKKFCEVTDHIDSLEEYLTKSFGKSNSEIARSVSHRILLRARSIISKAYHAALAGNLDQVLEELTSTDVSTRLLADTCRVLMERGELDPKEITGSEFISVHGGSFKGTLRAYAEQMFQFQGDQYGAKGSRYSELYPDLFTALDQSLRDRVENADKHSRFYLFTHQGELVGFFRFDDEFDSEGKVVRKHLASVIGNPKYKGGKIIETLLQQTLAKESDVPIYAESDRTKPIYNRYISMGFVDKGEDVELGLKVRKIELPPTKN